MKNYLLIRGPASSGKSVIAKKVANMISEEYFKTNSVLKHSIYNTYLLNFENFRARNVSKFSNYRNNHMATNLLVPYINTNIRFYTPIIEGEFQDEKLIEKLTNKLKGTGCLIKLFPSLEYCLENNKKKIKPVDSKIIKNSYDCLKYSYSDELVIDNTKLSISDTANEIFSNFLV